MRSSIHHFLFVIFRFQAKMASENKMTKSEMKNDNGKSSAFGPWELVLGLGLHGPVDTAMVAA